MGWIAIIILAIVQGATEFLPISSSGHLSLGHAIFGTHDEDVLVDIVLHAGTLIAVVVVYRRALLQILSGLARALWRVRQTGIREVMADPPVALAGYVVLASVVTGVVGLSLKDLVEGVLRGPAIVGTMLILNGFVLWSSRWGSGQDEGVGESLSSGLNIRRSLVIGLLQGLAVTPGISRSGMTITGGLHLGVSGVQAARYSFLLSIPAILGALVLKLGELDGTPSVPVTRLLVAALVAAVVGWACLVLLLKLLNRARFHHFSWYCWTLGAAAIIWGLTTG